MVLLAEVLALSGREQTSLCGDNPPRMCPHSEGAAVPATRIPWSGWSCSASVGLGWPDTTSWGMLQGEASSARPWLTSRHVICPGNKPARPPFAEVCDAGL